MQRKAGLVHKLQVARRAMIDGVVGVHRKPGHRVQGVTGLWVWGLIVGSLGTAGGSGEVVSQSYT